MMNKRQDALDIGFALLEDGDFTDLDAQDVENMSEPDLYEWIEACGFVWGEGGWEPTFTSDY